MDRHAKFATHEGAEAFACGIEYVNDSAITVTRIYGSEDGSNTPFTVDITDDEGEGLEGEIDLQCPSIPEWSLNNGT